MKNFSELVLLVLTLVFASSCDNNTSVDYLNTTYKTIKNQVGTCNDDDENNDKPCGKVDIKYPVFSGNDKKIDKIINERITKIISDFYDAKTIDGTSEKFLADFSSFITEFPDVVLNQWNLNINLKVDNNSEQLLSLTVKMYGYTGGAHGFSSITYFNFNPKTGKLLTLEDVVTDVDKVTALAKSVFIEQKKINPEKSINEQGYWFVNDDFSVNNNFKISPEGITFHYNQYEIAPYAEGDTDLLIPINKLKDLMTIKILH
jgi:hypothetical protein